ncbi:copper homeostasis protein CutC [Marilutibacter maris]|uniref:PF03932 family protein CutC n=1 Tax=Marilutibacter maris TaxID=1605891 RepID=A0A2U9T755_9GAMM|nr:copper homeostasis protein CutC [Lysobacter maris]AWV08391.1 copper homeostasis protein CutC [Lysobacter maris]
MSAGAPLLEIAANSLASALAAQAGGADRVELCENLGEGGCTPSWGTIAAARERLGIPLYVLVRPRAGDFLYDEDEREAMRRDIEACVRIGCDGVVIGALDADGDVDMATCRELVAAAGPLGVTFHRALDASRDPVAALEAAIALGCERVLTSGAQANALDGAATIATLVERAAGRIRVMAGAGVEAATLPLLRQRSGADEFHASARARLASPMRHRVPGLPGLEPERWQTDPARVAALCAALRDD